MAKTEPKTFEITEYSPAVLDMNTAFKTIKQIFSEYARGPAKHAVWVDMSGDKLKLHYHSYEMFLPERMREIEERADEIIKNTVKMMKKEFKDRTGATLKLVEQKELADSAREKVSLNQRFYFKAWRFFKISF